jgi:type I restriction enzyme, S subunit
MELKPGYKQTEVGVIPEDWDVKPFTEVTDLITCGIAATPEYVSEDAGVPFLSSTNVKDGQIQWSGFKYISKTLHRQLYNNNPPLRGDILYSRVGTFGEAGVIEVDFEFSIYVSLTLIKPIKSLDTYYLKQLLNSSAYKKRAKENIYLGGGVGNLNVELVRKYPIPLPPTLLEQQAIATALSDADAFIAGLEALLGKKRDLKTATMQQLLTGKTRLEGFSGEWKFHTLGEIGTFKNGINKGSEAFGHGSPFVNLMDVFGVNSIASRNHLGLVASTNFEKVTYDLRRGDVIFIRSSVKPSGVGLTAVVENDLIGTVYSGFLIRFRDDGFLDINFKKHCFYEQSFRSKIIGASSVSANTNINQDNLKRILIFLPPTLLEQQAIATVLSDMDAEIASLEAQLLKARDVKQGMMQELLTGRTRLV